MAHTTVRITEEARDLLRSMADAEGSSMQAILERALEAYRRQRFLDEVNTDYARLREEPGEWRTVEADRSLLDASLADGLPVGEVWTEDGKVLREKPKLVAKRKPRRRR